MKAYLIIDGDSITGSVANDFMNQLSNMQEMEIEHVTIACKAKTILSNYANFFSELSPTTELNLIKASALTNHSDMYCILWTGIYIERILSKGQNAMIFILSRDKLVLSAGSQVQRFGIGLCIMGEPIAPNINYEDTNTRIIKLETHGSQKKKGTTQEDITVPSWVDDVTEKEKKIGLNCLKVPTEEKHSKPEYIPFPDLSKIIIVGRDGDIPLKLWDVEKGLYPRNVEFCYHPYPDSSWTIRSLKGFRRGNKEIKLNDSILHANMEPRKLVTGDIIAMGGFLFEFITDKKEEFMRYESPETGMILVETSLQLFMKKAKDINVPLYIQEDLMEDGKVNWERAYLKHYRKLISANWRVPSLEKVRDHFKSKEIFNQRFVLLNELRNRIMHPSKQEIITEDDKELLAEFYFLTEELLK